MMEETRLADIVRDLRRTLFDLTERRYAHEREWETDEQEERREASNARRLGEWDAETERLIRGEASCPAS